jgi:hypothetical protein
MVFEPEKSESNLQGGKTFKGLFAILNQVVPAVLF